jgi:anti-sigma28 factor (negative regulator of flagellin synthesis)
MKIDDRVSSYLALLQKEINGEVATPAELGTAVSTGSTSPAEVDISPAAATLADDSARRERLSTIRQQLAEGSYNISGKDVADKILTILKG